MVAWARVVALVKREQFRVDLLGCCMDAEEGRSHSGGLDSGLLSCWEEQPSRLQLVCPDPSPQLTAAAGEVTRTQNEGDSLLGMGHQHPRSAFQR